MADRRVTLIEFEDMPTRYIFAAPILDKEGGTLSMQYEDGTIKVFNWDYVVDYYYMTAEETKNWTQDVSE